MTQAGNPRSDALHITQSLNVSLSHYTRLDLDLEPDRSCSRPPGRDALLIKMTRAARTVAWASEGSDPGAGLSGAYCVSRHLS